MIVLATGETVTGPEAGIVEENARLRIGLIGVTIIIVGVYTIKEFCERENILMKKIELQT